MELDVREMPCWCASCKVSGLNNYNCKDLKISYILQQVFDSGENYSSISISANETETDLIEWLRKNKFRRGPMVRNYENHGGRKTWLFNRQTTKTEIKKYLEDY